MTERIKIYLNVFHLAPLINKVFRCFNVGAYHSQLSINDEDEVYYGFSNLSGTGIRHSEVIGDPPPELAGVQLYKKFDLGYSHYNLTECKIIISEMENNPDWLAEHYHIFYHNCNSFTLSLCRRILDISEVEKVYPKWITNGEKKVGRFIFETSIAYTMRLFVNKKIFVFGSSVGDDNYVREMRKENPDAELPTDDTNDSIQKEIRYDFDSDGFEPYSVRPLAEAW
ncbi:hypothetical protein M9Y10_008963 [Tritrichomonas musculus]|uniref:PPPDE domain-containing protein n=1 Tax=Tritrichomonas musculus TaxID=1915356 RepID=A0ABR2J0J9_9EUKA